VIGLASAENTPRPVTLLLILVIIALVSLPFVGVNPYILHLGFLTFLYVSLSSAWNILGGFAGQVSFGYSAFFGLGAYATGILWNAGVNPYLTLPVGALLALAFSLLVGYPCFRLSGPYFAIATIGIGEAMRVIMLNLGDITGGASGLTMPTTGGFSKTPSYLSALLLMIAVLLLVNYIRNSRIGLALLAIKEDQDAAEALGVPTIRYKLLAHGLGAIIVGIAGGLYAQYMFYIEPNNVFGFNLSISLLLMPVIGGLATLWGPVLGAIVFVVIQDTLMASFPHLHLLTYGLLLVVIVLFEPDGLMGLFGRLARFLRSRYAEGQARAPSGEQSL